MSHGRRQPKPPKSMQQIAELISTGFALKFSLSTESQCKRVIVKVDSLFQQFAHGGLTDPS